MIFGVTVSKQKAQAGSTRGGREKKRPPEKGAFSQWPGHPPPATGLIKKSVRIKGKSRYLLNFRNGFMETVSKEQLYELIEALPETEIMAVKRFLEFLISLREGEEYFSPEDLAEIEEGFAQIKRGEHVEWDEFKKRHGL